MIEIIVTVGWLILGAINLCSKNEISKLSYFCVWTIAMAGLIKHFFM